MQTVNILILGNLDLVFELCFLSGPTKIYLDLKLSLSVNIFTVLFLAYLSNCLVQITIVNVLYMPGMICDFNPNLYIMVLIWL